MSSTQNSNLQPSYEPYEPRMETSETEDAHILLVHLPDFTRQQVGAYYEAAHKRIRVFGEKPIENNKRIRFSTEHKIPEDCDADKLKGQFQEGATITITIPRKPKEPEPEPAQEQEAVEQITTTPPESASEVESEAPAAMKNGEKVVSEEKSKSEIESSQKESVDEKDDKPTPPEPEVTEESKMPQKDAQREDQKNHGDEKIRENADDSSSITEKEKDPESGIPRNDQDQEGEGIPQEDDKNDKNQKKISQEGKASLQKDQFLARQKSKESEGDGYDLVIAGLNKTPEEREKDDSFQKDQCLEIEKSKEERKESAMNIATKSYDIGLKKTSEKKEEKQMGVKTDRVHEERSHENTVSSESSSVGKGTIKNMANSASQAVTRLANRFSEEDKQKKLLCAGAAILVVAVGIYASFKLRSMTRQ